MNSLPHRSYLMVVALLLYPALAAADPGCRSSFESWGCFMLVALGLAAVVLPALLVGLVILGTLRARGKLPGPRYWRAFGGSIPWAVLTIVGFTWASDRIKNFSDKGFAVFCILLAALQLVYVALAVRWVRLSRVGSSASHSGR